MNAIIDILTGNKEVSEAKSYHIGMERGRVWAENIADYFDMRRWSERTEDDIEILNLPNNEEEYFTELTYDTPLEWDAYVKGWLDGVKEIRERY